MNRPKNNETKAGYFGGFLSKDSLVGIRSKNIYKLLLCFIVFDAEEDGGREGRFGGRKEEGRGRSGRRETQRQRSGKNLLVVMTVMTGKVVWLSLACGLPV